MAEQERKPIVLTLNEQKPYEVGRQTVETPSTSTTYIQAPDAQTQQFVDKNILQPAQEQLKSPISVIGYDPEVERQRREREQRTNDIKRKEAGWYNAIALLGDAGSALLGGNVWQREPDRTAAQAKADNERLTGEQKAEDARNAALQRAAAQQYAQLASNAYQTFGRKVTEKTGGEKNTTVQYQNMRSTRQQQEHTGYGRYVGRSSSSSSSSSGGGKSTNEVVKVQYKAPDGSISSYDFKVDKGTAEAMGTYLSAAVGNLAKDKKNGVAKKLAASNILPKKQGDVEQYDPKDMLRSGILFDDPQILNEFYKVIDNDTELSQEERDLIKSTLVINPITQKVEDKVGWWDRLKGWFKGEPSSENQQSSKAYVPKKKQAEQAATQPKTSKSGF